MKVRELVIVIGEGHGVLHVVVELRQGSIAVKRLDTFGTWWESSHKCYVNKALAAKNFNENRKTPPAPPKEKK